MVRSLLHSYYDKRTPPVWGPFANQFPFSYLSPTYPECPTKVGSLFGVTSILGLTVFYLLMPSISLCTKQSRHPKSFFWVNKDSFHFVGVSYAGSTFK